MSPLARHGILLLAFAVFAWAQAARGQTPVQVGAGSYASQVPGNDYYTDSYYGLPAAQMEPLTSGSCMFNMLHLDPSLSGLPIPTNHWWTDMLISDRSALGSGSTQYMLKQDPYGGNMWFLPGMLAPRSYGFDLYLPNSWPTPNGSSQGAIVSGPPLPVHGDVAYHIPGGDVLIADFENGYPAGTTIAGNGFAATPSTGSGLTGMMGSYCASTRDAGNGGTGTVTLPAFTITKHYLNFLICGGTFSDTAVQLVVSGTTVLSASGQTSTAFRWVTWDLSQWAGQTAKVVLTDQETGNWGFLACDQVVESDSNAPSGRFGGDLIATNSVITNWGDWNLDFKLPDGNGNEVDVMMARGVPFTWSTWKGGMNPKIAIGGTTAFYDVNNNVIASGTGFTTNAFAFNYQGRTYGVFLPDNTPVTVTSTYVEPQLSGDNNYMVVGYLPAASNLAEFAAYAFARPTNTQMSWSYQPTAGMVNTTWTVTATPLKGSNTSTIQGWLPHHYRTTTNNLVFRPYTYATPRGTMQCAIGSAFQIAFPFKGLVPILPAPMATGTVNDFQPARMLAYLSEFQPGTMMGDTYWSGKAMALCAQYMAFANQMGDTADFVRLQSALETAMANWLTYTPGESLGYFAQYPNWHAMIGWDASYGTQAFNDLHFHYGYYAVAGSIIGMYDPQFLQNYGPMLKLLVKCYGNWDRTDTSEPFLRMFDVWEGHCNAGGESSVNGENQESSSEAMQSWAGMFLLGSMLGDNNMTAAGAMGYSIESCADNEYWQDIYQTNFPASYQRAGNGILSANSYDYGTYFSGDPAWVYGIQYTPSNHWLNDLTRYQPATVAAKYQAMWTERANWCASYPLWNGTSTYVPNTPTAWVHYNQYVYSVTGTNPVTGGSSPDVNTGQWMEQANCSKSEPDVLGGGLDHVILVYEGLFDPNTAAAQFDTYYANGENTATNTSDSGDTYYHIHSNRVLGTQDYTTTTSMPTSSVYVNPSTGVRTYVVLNSSTTTGQAVVYNSGAVTGTMTIPGLTLVSSTNPNYVPTAPAAPTGLAALAGYGTVGLTWNAIVGVNDYNVKRSGTSGGPYTTIGTATAGSFTDAGATPGNTYFYVVSAVNTVGEGANSGEVYATVIGAPAAAINCGGPAVAPFAADGEYSGGTTSTTAATIDLSGVASPAPMAVYQSYRYGNMTYTLTGLSHSTTYDLRLHFSENFWTLAGKREFNLAINGTTALTNYDIFAVAGAKNKAAMEEMTATSDTNGQIVLKFTNVKDNAACNGIEVHAGSPAAPTGVAAVSGTGHVALSWTASAGAVSYNVMRSGTSGGAYTVIGNPASAGFVDSSLVPGTVYYYVVAAVSAAGVSGNSAEVSGSATATGLQQWRQAYFGTTNPSDSVGGNMATPMNDGVPNLMKYALGLNPAVAVAPNGLFQWQMANGELSVTFTRVKAATDVTYHVQASGDMSAWTDIWSSANVSYGGGANASQQVNVTDNPGGGAMRRFVRLTITQP